MKIFVVNCGSSSIKYQLFSMTREIVLAKGVLERVGTDEAELHHSIDGREIDRKVSARDHTEGMKHILAALVDDEAGVISSVSDIEGVGHRVVHGGEQMAESRRIDEQVMQTINGNAELAPLHNPPNLMGIRAAMQAMPEIVHVAVFDTAFLNTLPPTAYRYAVPESWYTEHHVRKYGFHGTSHRYVTYKAADLLGKSVEKVNLITAHLGNGCSITAVREGKAVDHSMGMTPLEGLVMGTRCGDIDPAVPLYMQGRGFTHEQVEQALNKESGLLGVSGHSNDMRDLLIAAGQGNEKASMAVDLFVTRIIKYVGAYYTLLPDVDALVLTGGIGENSLPVRRKLCEGLRRLGAVPDEDRNRSTVRGSTGPISANGSLLPVWVIPTNEELMIARDTRRIVTSSN
jgi:acetate kinase